jgi:hypothetical protein
MEKVLMSLEPRTEGKDTILAEENKEWSEVMFFSTGTFFVGYELNRKNCFVLDFHTDK